MMTIDHSTQNIKSTGKLKKLGKKIANKKTNFSHGIKTHKNHSNTPTEEVSGVSPMLFLQEIDEYANDLQNLDNFADQAFRCLKDLQLSLIQNTLSKRHLHNLQDSIQNAKNKFNTPELEQLAKEIQTRVEVEIAKMEVSSEFAE
jgi:hypothetical protein